MLFEHIDLLDDQFEHKKDQFVGIREGKIAYIGAERPEGDG